MHIKSIMQEDTQKHSSCEDCASGSTTTKAKEAYTWG